jgi:hypothetical protein
LFETSPEVFQRFGELVDNPGTFHSFLTEGGYLDGVASILSIGAGEGVLETRLMHEFGVQMGYVDPTVPYVAAYRESIRAAGLGDLAVAVFCGRFQDYPPQRTFDLVLSIHSWYAIGTDAAALEKALACRSARGRLVIALASEESFDIKWANLVAEPDQKYITAEQISTWSKQAGIAHEYRVCARAMAVQQLVQNGEFTADGRAMFSFLARTPFEEIPASSRALVADLLESCQRGGVLQKTAGCLVF